MALQFILGNSGSGKTRYIHEKIIRESDLNPKKNYFCVVPEQFTMQTQRELVRLQKAHSVMNIDIVSFGRLAYRVFDELGSFTYQVLEETGKNLILRKIAEEKQSELSVLQKNMTRMGYINEVKSLISELAQYNVTPEQLESVLEELPSGSFAYKLQDVLTMYQGFLDFLQGRFVTAEDVLGLLIDVADDSKILKNSVIVFDGFTGFTPIQNQLFRKLLTIADQIYVTVTIDERENFYRSFGSHELFAMSKKMIQSLNKMADEMHVIADEPVVLSHSEKSRFHDAKALYFLEQNLFRNTKKVYEIPEASNEIQIKSYQNPREELMCTATKICHLVQDEGYRYKDIAIVCGELPTYASYAVEVFADYEIPLFIDQKMTIVFHPLIEFVQSLLDVVQRDFSVESVFRYLRSGLSQIPRDEIDMLENYVLAAGIRGYYKWKDIFAYVPKGFDGEAVAKVNEIREKFITQFEEIYSSIKKPKCTVRLVSELLYHFICDREIEIQMKEKEIYYENNGDQKKAKEYAQIYRIVMDLLDKTVELLGEEEITLEEYAKILNAGFEAAKVGTIPPGYDRVVLGDIERTRLDEIKILFFVGVNDGVIPKSGGADGILSQFERELLQEHDMELAPTVREQTFIQKFYLYLNLTKPSQRLYVSYTRVDGEGKAKRSSYLIHTLLRMYKNLKVEEIEKQSLAERIVTPKSAFALVAEGLEYASDWRREQKEKEQELWAALCQYYQKEETYQSKVNRLIEASSLHQQDTPIQAAVVKALYGNVLHNSVTRLEKFASCAYAHFLSYGLELKERTTSQFAASDIGNMFHAVLEEYAKLMQKEKKSWFEISQEESEGLLERAMEHSLEKNQNLALYDTARDSYAKMRMMRILKRTIWTLTEQVRKGRFVPRHFEISFDHVNDLDAVRFKLGEDESMKLQGRIDRIDTFEDNDRIYVKVIDYKSGNTSFQLLNIYHGLQLQLVVYMNAALELMHKKHPAKEVLPAGIFYYHVNDPMIDVEEEISQEELRSKILKELKLNGVLSNEQKVITEMDATLMEDGAGNSDVIPVGINKDGSIKKISKVLPYQDFHTLSSYVNETILDIGNRMMAGEVQTNPYRLGDASGCDYCEYKNICHFDARMEGYEYRKLKEMSQDEILAKMKGGQADGDEVDEGSTEGH